MAGCLTVMMSLQVAY